MEILDRVVIGNTLESWLYAVGGAIGAFVLVRGALALVRSRLARIADRTATRVDDLIVAVLQQTKSILLLMVSLAVAGHTLDATPRIDRTLTSIAIVTALAQIGIWTSALFSSWLRSDRERRLERDPATATTLDALNFVGRLLIWSIVLLVAADNLGFDVTAVLAGLGVGGIAVALALQSVLGDLFASLSIVLDKPFVLGDFLIVDEHLGIVEHVGLRTTRIRSLSGEQLVFSNTDLLSARIKNYGRMHERRVAFGFSVTYQTTPAQLRKIPEIVREAIEQQENVRFDRSHFKGFGESALDFESVYYVGEADYNVYMDVQQAINLRIFERFHEESIAIAYPTRTLYVQSTSEFAGVTTDRDDGVGVGHAHDRVASS